MERDGMAARALALLVPLLLPACGHEPPPPLAPQVPAVLRKGTVPAPVDWGREPCASCEMPVADRTAGAQCQDPEGYVHTFDDLGCLVIEMGSGRLSPRAIVFRHRDEDRWLAPAEAGFVRAEKTPMGFGFAAVDAGPSTMTFVEVRDELARRFGLDAFGAGQEAR